MQLLKSAIYCALIFSQLCIAMEHERNGNQALVQHPRARHQRANHQRGNIYVTNYNIEIINNMPVTIHFNPERSGPSFLHLALIGTAAITLVGLALKDKIEKHIAQLEYEIDSAHEKYQHEYNHGFELGFQPCAALGIKKPNSPPSIVSMGKKAGTNACKLQKLLFKTQAIQIKQTKKRLNSMLKNQKNKGKLKK